MEIIVRDEKIPKNCYECSYLNLCSLKPNFKPTISKCPLKPLSQYDLETRADERKKVVAELEKWAYNNNTGFCLGNFVTDDSCVIPRKQFMQKLTELKGECDENI